MNRNTYKQLESDIISFRPELKNKNEKSFRWGDTNCVSIIANEFASISDVHYLYSEKTNEVGFHIHKLIYKPLYDLLKLNIKDDRISFEESNGKKWLGYIKVNQKINIDTNYNDLISAFQLLYDIINPIILDYVPSHKEYNYNVWLWWHGNEIIKQDYLEVSAEFEGYKFTDFHSADDFRKTYKKEHGKSPDSPIPASDCEFTKDVKIGDIIVAYLTIKGHKYIYGWGNFISDCIAHPNKPNSNIRKVAWREKYSSNPKLADFITNTYYFQRPTEDQLFKIVNMLNLNNNTIELTLNNDLVNKEMNDISENVKKATQLLNNTGQIILQGAPGCGKTYITTELAVYLCDGQIPAHRKDLKARYKELENEGRIAFTTFHQSLDYEEFVEGLKPEKSENGEMVFEVKSGLFKKMCQNASSTKLTRNFNEAYDNFVSDISENDEITKLTTQGGKEFGVKVNSNNNLSLFTGNHFNQNGVLTKENIEREARGDNKRIYWSSYFSGVVQHLIKNYGLSEEEQSSDKKYVLIIDEINRANISKVLGELITLLEKSKRMGNDDEVSVILPYSGEKFSVPDNLYIIGTMNTADRSLGYIDYAIRRRFAFLTLKADKEAIESYYKDKDQSVKTKELKLFDEVYKLIEKNIAADFEIDDIMVGHSQFMAKDEDDYQLNLEYKIKPLLLEYLRDGLLVDKGNLKDTIKNLGSNNTEE